MIDDVKTDEPEEAVDATAEEVQAEIEEFLPESTDLIVRDPSDENDLAAVMDRHDVAQILMEIQQRALNVWVYDIPGDGGKRRRELSYKGVRDIVGLMNRTGRVKIGTMPETLKLERIVEDIGNGGPEPLVRATIFAREEVTGQAMPGIATEPVYMKLTERTANQKRSQGKEIPADNRVFDAFAETKAANKAVRNALRTFIPEEAAQTVIAMFTGESSRVQRIQTETEAKLEDLPAPLDTDEAKTLIARCEVLYDEIRELGGGRGKIKLTPGTFSAWMLRSHHDVGSLERFIAYLEERKEQIPGELEREDEEQAAVDTAKEIACPECGAERNKFCKGIRGVHGERVRARLEQIRAQKGGK